MSMKEMREYVSKIHNRGSNWDVIKDEVESFMEGISAALNNTEDSPKHVHCSKTYSKAPLAGYKIDCEIEVYDESIFAGYKDVGIEILILRLLRICAAGITKSYSFEFPLPNNGFLKFAIEYQHQCETLMPGFPYMKAESPRICGIAQRWCNNAERVKNIVFECCEDAIESCIGYSLYDKIASKDENFSLTFIINGQKYKTGFMWLNDAHTKAGYPIKAPQFAFRVKNILGEVFRDIKAQKVHIFDDEYMVFVSVI